MDSGPRALHSLTLRNFKAFEKLYLPLAGHTNILVGPNNAGKSTALSALRSAAFMTRMAFRLGSSSIRQDGDYRVRAYPFTSAQVGLEDENLRFDFRPADVRLELTFTSGLSVRALWPTSEDDPPFFYFARGNAPVLRKINLAVECPEIGMVPVLTPVEHNEQLLTQDYIGKNLSSRLASRHFRNQLEILSREPSETHSSRFHEFVDFMSPWLPEMALQAPVTRPAEKGYEIDVYYREGSATREVVWAGDGMQVFAQLLLQLFRQRVADVILLDEPDVYLHADLQRRLLQVLARLGPQVVIASHSTEMMAEAPPESVVWVDRTRQRAVRSPAGVALEQLSTAIGSQFNLRLARVLRAQVALFVEGKDVGLLRILAEKIGAPAFVSETNLAVVPMEGATNWRRLEGFTWLVEQMLQRAVKGYVLLDRDYHSDDAASELVASLNRAGLKVHIWSRHELESYLIVPDVIARTSSMSLEWITETLTEITEQMHDLVLGGMIDTRFAERQDKRQGPGPIAAACAAELTAQWSDFDRRISLCPAKEILSAVNGRLQGSGNKALSAFALAHEMLSGEVPEEMTKVLREVDRLAKPR